MTKEQFTVNQAQVAYLLGVTTRTIQAWGKRQSDPLPAAERTIRGQAKTYDPQVAVRWYLRNELAKLGPDGEVLDLNAERARLAKQQADKIEMENARLRGELVPVAVVRRYLEGILMAFRSRVLAIPQNLRRWSSVSVPYQRRGMKLKTTYTKLCTNYHGLMYRSSGKN